MERCILAIDQGTTGSRVMIVNAAGRIVADAYSEFEQLYPQPGWVEHDPERIWQTTVGVLRRALSSAGIPLAQVAGIGITNQRETTVLWDAATGKPLHHAIVWQDRRTAGRCDEILDAQRRRADKVLAILRHKGPLCRKDLSVELFGKVHIWDVYLTISEVQATAELLESEGAVRIDATGALDLIAAV